MKADEIRAVNPIAGESWSSPKGVGEQIYQLTTMVQEVAAQLAELNEKLDRVITSKTQLANDVINVHRVGGGR